MMDFIAQIPLDIDIVCDIVPFITFLRNSLYANDYLAIKFFLLQWCNDCNEASVFVQMEENL